MGEVADFPHKRVACKEDVVALMANNNVIRLNSDAEPVDDLQRRIHSCRLCPCFDEGPHRFAGKAGNRIMLIGQAPARPRGPEGRPFGVGNGHLRLFRWLSDAGFEEEEFRSKTYMTSITKCYPGPSPGGKGDRKPGKAEVEACSGYMQEEIDLIRPALILLIGQMAIGMFIGEMKLSEAVGQKFEKHFDGWDSRIIPLPHPSGASLWNNLPENQALVKQAIGLISEARIDLGLQEISTHV